MLSETGARKVRAEHVRIAGEEALRGKRLFAVLRTVGAPRLYEKMQNVRRLDAYFFDFYLFSPFFTLLFVGIGGTMIKNAG